MQSQVVKVAQLDVLAGLTVECAGAGLPERFAAHLLEQMGATVVAPAGLPPPRAEYRYDWAVRASTGGAARPDVALVSGSTPGALRWLEGGTSVVRITADDAAPDASDEPVDLLAAHGGGYAMHLVWSSDRPAADPPRRAVADQMLLATGAVAAFLASALAASPRSTPVVVALSARDVAVSLLLPELGDRTEGLLSRERRKLVGGSKVAGGLVGLLRTADGHVIVSPRGQHQWERLLGLIGDDDLARDPRFASVAQRQAGWETLQPLLERLWSAERRAEEVFETCQTARVPCFPVRTVAELLGDRHLAARDFWSGTAHPEPGLPFRVVAVARPADA